MAKQTVSASDFVRLAKSHLNVLQSAHEEIEEAQRRHQAKMQELHEAREKVLNELAEVSLPALSREAFSSAASFTGYRKFEIDDPFERMERRRRELSARAVQIESDEKYQRRDQLLDAAAGELTLRREEIDKQLKLMDEALAQYEGEAEFLGLVQRGYDTDQYKIKWWRPQYYKDWKYGDLITEKFGQGSFREVLSAYLQVKAGRGEFHQDLLRIQQQIAEVESLVASRENCLSSLETLESDTLNVCRSQLREHLEYIDRQDLAAWSAPDPHRTGVIKRLHGIEKQMEYLDELAVRYLNPERGQLAKNIAKANKIIAKYMRPKNAGAAIPVAEANRALADPRGRLAARRRRFDESYQTVLLFDRYDAFDYTRDMLWWDLMTDGRIDGDFIPEVQAWRDQHPGRPRLYDAGPSAPETGLTSSGRGAGEFGDVS